MRADTIAAGAAAEPFRPVLARLYFDAFAGKLRMLLGAGEPAVGLLAPMLSLDRAVVAIASGSPVGIAGYCLDGRRLVGAPRFLALARARAIMGAAAGLLAAALLHRREPTDALLLDGIAVAPAWRGRGIGTRLLDALRDVATRAGRRALELGVVDTNPAARRLYERYGFVPCRERRLGAAGRALFGFDGVVTMRCRLS